MQLSLVEKEDSAIPGYCWEIFPETSEETHSEIGSHAGIVASSEPKEKG